MSDAMPMAQGLKALPRPIRVRWEDAPLTIGEAGYMRVLCEQYVVREICIALVECNHNRTNAAKMLGVSRRKVLNRIKRHTLRSRIDVGLRAVETTSEIRARINGLRNASTETGN